jgi:putative Mg2+ transporter-C (MgtC) family protein
MQLSLSEVAKHMIAALVAGGVIGTERSIHGRAAGFRTHTLVCMASSVLMLVTLFESQWLPLTTEAIRMDPTRMAQGIMTGIGFLGAGVIFKEGLTVRGLTTAASIWTTSAIGILMGTGLYAAGALATALTLGVLSIFRRIELWFPVQVFARHAVQFARASAMSQAAVRALLSEHGFTVSDFSYSLDTGADVLEYRMAIQTVHPENMDRLAETLSALQSVRGFTISPAGD